MIQPTDIAVASLPILTTQNRQQRSASNIHRPVKAPTAKMPQPR